MKILLVHGGSDLYGASQSVLRLTSRLVKDGHRVRVVVPDEGQLISRLEAAGVEVVVHSDLGVVTRHQLATARGRFQVAYRIPRSMAHLEREIARWRPELVHTNTALIVSSGAAARLRGVPHVWHIREFFREFPVLWRAYRHYIHQFTDIIVCVSGAVACQFEGRCYERVRVVHNGFPLSEFEGISSQRVAAFRRRFGLEGLKAVGVVGRIKLMRKGQETFIRAAALLRDLHPNVRFLLIGSPFSGNESHLDEVRKLIEMLGVGDRVIYTGDIEDIGAAYSAMDVLVLASGMPEPFAGVVVEAMACGKPVVGTRHGGTVEQIEDGQTGLLVDANHPDAMARALDRLLSDDEGRLMMGRNSRARFMQCFEFEPFYARMLEIYHEAMNGSAPKAARTAQA